MPIVKADNDALTRRNGALTSQTSVRTMSERHMRSA